MSCKRVSWTPLSTPDTSNQFLIRSPVRKTQFLRYYSVREANYERLAERETLLHRLGSELNRTVLNSCGNSIIRTENNT